MPTKFDGGATGNRRILKVAQVIGSAQGGVMSCVVNYYRSIDRSKVQFDFFTYEESSYDEEIRALGGEVFHFPNIFKPSAAKVLTELFQRNGYDIVHAHLTTRSGFALKAAKKAGVQVRICHSHSSTHPSEGIAFWAKTVLKHFAVKYATHYAGCCVKSNLWLFGKKKGKEAFVMLNAIDLQRFHPKTAAEQDKAEKTVGFVGRFAFQKNVSFLIKSFAKLQKKQKGVRLVLVGDGAEKEKLKKLADKLCPEKIVFRDESRNIEDAYRSFDLFVLSSRFEGLPLVAVEAQACGVPCLLSDRITKEVDVGGRVKFLPLKYKKKWAAAMSEMLSENAEPKLLDLSDYDITVQAPKLLAYYEKISRVAEK